MRRIGSNLQKRRVIMALLTLVLMNTGCDERFDNPAVNPSEEKTVEVSMAIGFADEADACNLSASTKANANAKGKGAFDVELVPTATTRADASVKPDQLYKLEIRQYKQNGDCYTTKGQTPTDKEIGQRFSVSLTEDADCQLVFVAWGEGSSLSLGTKALSDAQEISIDATTINAISTTNMNKMPYVLHLKHVNVTSDGKITNPDGIDVCILLKRLATRLNISWDYNVTGYDLKQIILQSIPRNYKVVPAPDEKSMNTYPSLMDQYADIQLTAARINATNKSYSCWIPANVRGINTVSNGPQYRIKENAPTGSSYVSFIAANTSNGKKKLNYRIYLGGKDYSDYNLNENTDYSYKINFKHTGLPVDDKRVTIIDPIPASQNNENLIPTANCFMVAPGGAFCFDPFTYQQKGITINNDSLISWAKNEGGITSVKLLWQTKENGDIGDPVMGVVNSADDHSNVVDIKRTDGTSISDNPLKAVGDGRIYCRVAPNTTGGSGVIAACNAKGEILWSWHVWVTDYSPDSKGDIDVQTPENKRKQKYYRSDLTSQLPMMDRNLGAVAGYNNIPESELDRSKANGFLYQWGRKDSFRSSYSNKAMNKIDVPAIDKPIVGLLSLFKEDGVTFYPFETIKKKKYYRDAYKTPQYMYKENSTSWYPDYGSESYYLNSWGQNGDKGLHDPCPAGWRVCQKSDYYPLFTSSSYDPGTVSYKSATSIDKDGGLLICYDGSNYTYYRFAGYWQGLTLYRGINLFTFLWCRDMYFNYGKGSRAYHLILNSETSPLITRIYNDGRGVEQEALSLRCIQEQK